MIWNKQEEKDIYDAITAINDWECHRYACLMKDNTLQEFIVALDESYNGEINVHIDCVNDNYYVDDIKYWIEIILK